MLLNYPRIVLSKNWHTFSSVYIFEHWLFFLSLGASGRWKQMVQSLLPSRPALHLCHSLLKRTASSPTPQMCSSHPQASCPAHTLTYLVSAYHRASWVGCERCLEGPDHNFVLASSKQVMPSQHRGYACDFSVHRKKLLLLNWSVAIQAFTHARCLKKFLQIL